RKIDEEYRLALAKQGLPEPEWLGEHLSADYPEIEPTSEFLRRAAREMGRNAAIEVRFSEWDTGARLIRRSAARSAKLSLLVDLILGVVASVIPRPPRERSYRAILVALLT